MLNTAYVLRLVNQYDTVLPEPNKTDEKQVEEVMGGNENLTKSLDLKVMQIERDSDIQHGGDNCVVFFEDTTGELVDICNVENITKGVSKIRDILKVNGKQNVMLKNWEQAKGLYQFNFGCKTAHFYIRQY